MTTEVVRVSEEADFAPIRALAVAHARFEKSDAVIPGDWASRVASLIHRGQLAMWVAERRGIPLGYASVTEEISTWTGRSYAHLDCLYVDGEYRNAGVGRLLIETVFAHAKSRGADEVQWQTPEWNAAAIRFYARLGVTRQSKERFTHTLA